MVKLQVRVQVKSGDRNYPFVSPAYSPNGKIKAGLAIIFFCWSSALIDDLLQFDQ